MLGLVWCAGKEGDLMLVLSELCFTGCVPVLVEYDSPVVCTGINCVQGNMQLE